MDGLKGPSEPQPDFTTITRMLQPIIQYGIRELQQGVTPEHVLTETSLMAYFAGQGMAPREAMNVVEQNKQAWLPEAGAGGTSGGKWPKKTRPMPAGMGMPGYGVPTPGAPGYGQPGYGAPTGGAPGYGKPAYGAPAAGAPGYGKPAYGAPTAGAPGYGKPAYGAPTAGAPGYGKPAYGAPAAGAPGYGKMPMAKSPMTKGIGKGVPVPTPPFPYPVAPPFAMPYPYIMQDCCCYEDHSGSCSDS